MVKNKKNNDKKVNYKKSREHKYFRAACFIVIVVALGILVGTISYTIYHTSSDENYRKSVLSYQKIPVSVEVIENRLGLNVDTDALKFGRIPPGDGGTRFLNITTKERARLEIYAEGPITRFISTDSNNKILEANIPYIIPIQIDLPNNTVSGKYDGTLYVILLKP